MCRDNATGGRWITQARTIQISAIIILFHYLDNDEKRRVILMKMEVSIIFCNMWIKVQIYFEKGQRKI